MIERAKELLEEAWERIEFRGLLGTMEPVMEFPFEYKRDPYVIRALLKVKVSSVDDGQLIRVISSHARPVHHVTTSLEAHQFIVRMIELFWQHELEEGLRDPHPELTA